jgi:hypothetical protein
MPRVEIAMNMPAECNLPAKAAFLNKRLKKQTLNKKNWNKLLI